MWCPALGLDLEQPDYDMDSEDETLLNRLNRKMEIKPLQFETMVDRLEKASTHQVTHLNTQQVTLSTLYLSVCDNWLCSGSGFSSSLCRRQSCCWTRTTICWSRCTITGWGSGRTAGVRSWFLISNRRRGMGQPTMMPMWPSDGGLRRCRPGRSVAFFFFL